MKTALVTGSTKGIGKAIAEKLLENGYFVVLNYSNSDFNASQTENEFFEKYRGRFSIIKADLSNLNGVKHLFDTTINTLNKFNENRLDVLVLNAGTTCRQSFDEMSYSEWEHVMNVNLNLPFELVRLFNVFMREHGRIIFISSVLGKYPHATSLPYNVSKAGVTYLAKSLVKEFCDRMITVNAISTGFCDTSWQREKPVELRKRIEEKIALHRFAKPEEIARICMEVIDNEYINGSEIAIDGGYCYR